MWNWILDKISILFPRIVSVVQFTTLEWGQRWASGDREPSPWKPPGAFPGSVGTVRVNHTSGTEHPPPDPSPVLRATGQRLTGLQILRPLWALSLVWVSTPLLLQALRRPSRGLWWRPEWGLTLLLSTDSTEGNQALTWPPPPTASLPSGLPTSVLSRGSSVVNLQLFECTLAPSPLGCHMPGSLSLFPSPANCYFSGLSWDATPPPGSPPWSLPSDLIPPPSALTTTTVLSARPSLIQNVCLISDQKFPMIIVISPQPILLKWKHWIL